MTKYKYPGIKVSNFGYYYRFYKYFHLEFCTLFESRLLNCRHFENNATKYLTY